MRHLRDLLQLIRGYANTPGFWAGYLLTAAYLAYAARHTVT
jgi:hypothetical protein